MGTRGVKEIDRDVCEMEPMTMSQTLTQQQAADLKHATQEAIDRINKLCLLGENLKESAEAVAQMRLTRDYGLLAEDALTSASFMIDLADQLAGEIDAYYDDAQQEYVYRDCTRSA